MKLRRKEIEKILEEINITKEDIVALKLYPYCFDFRKPPFSDPYDYYYELEYDLV